MSAINTTPIEIEFMAFGLAIILIRLDRNECYDCSIEEIVRIVNNKEFGYMEDFY